MNVKWHEGMILEGKFKFNDDKTRGYRYKQFKQYRHLKLKTSISDVFSSQSSSVLRVVSEFRALKEQADFTLSKGFDIQPEKVTLDSSCRTWLVKSGNEDVLGEIKSKLHFPSTKCCSHGFYVSIVNPDCDSTV